MDDTQASSTIQTAQAAGDNNVAAAAATDAVYTLHYFTFSLYSLMARFGLALGRQLKPETAPRITLQFVNTADDDNLSEHYLTQVNPRGQVPSLTSPELAAPISDSRGIATWLCAKQPELLPEEHKETIARLMEKLYHFHLKALNIPADAANTGIPNKAAAMLENPGLSEQHRRALEIKSVFHDTLHCRTVEPEHIANVEEHVREFMTDLEAVLGENKTDGVRWALGGKPSLLDAYVAPLVIRLMEVGRMELMPEAVQAYGTQIGESDEWKQLTHGRRTVWDASMGPIEDLDPK